MFRLLKPKYFIPVHGETRHLYRNAQLAEEMGIDPSHIFMMDNGNVLELGKRSVKLNGTVPSGAILIDGLGVGDIGAAVLRERRLLSQVRGKPAYRLPSRQSSRITPAGAGKTRPRHRCSR